MTVPNEKVACGTSCTFLSTRFNILNVGYTSHTVSWSTTNGGVVEIKPRAIHIGIRSFTSWIVWGWSCRWSYSCRYNYQIVKENISSKMYQLTGINLTTQLEEYISISNNYFLPQPFFGPEIFPLLSRLISLEALSQQVLMFP